MSRPTKPPAPREAARELPGAPRRAPDTAGETRAGSTAAPEVEAQRDATASAGREAQDERSRPRDTKSVTPRGPDGELLEASITFTDELGPEIERSEEGRPVIPARVATGTLVGIEAYAIVVEANRGCGLPGMQLIGLARGAAKESLVRVRAALKSSVPQEISGYRTVLNLIPAELPKNEAALDLPLAMALLVSHGVLPPSVLEGRRYYGELSLSGHLEPIRGAVLLADLARRSGDEELVVPAANAPEAAVIPGVRVVGANTLGEVIEHLAGTNPISPSQPMNPEARGHHPCLSEVRGQHEAKRALIVAAAGGHNMLMLGPPGSGKTMLARCLPGLMPPLDDDESIEVTRIYSVAGRLQGRGLISERPFRAPHHTASEAALCGGGTYPRPGEVTLAHRGVLFLDELPEFSRRALESLREPLEEGHIHIARASASMTFPARVLLVAAMNPCPCGRYRGDMSGRPRAAGAPCMCTFEQVMRYRSRISGPLLDRIDLHLVVDALPFGELARMEPGEPTAAIQPRVQRAREAQRRRLGPGRTNASMDPAEVRQHVPLDAASRECIERAVMVHGLSARAVSRVLKVARTLADLEEHPTVELQHIRQALAFRVLDRDRADLGSAPPISLATG